MILIKIQSVTWNNWSFTGMKPGEGGGALIIYHSIMFFFLWQSYVYDLNQSGFDFITVIWLIYLNPFLQCQKTPSLLNNSNPFGDFFKSYSFFYNYHELLFDSFK